MSSVCTISDTVVGRSCTVCADVYSIEAKEPKPGIQLVEITLTDQTGTLIVAAFRQNWLLKSIKAKDKIVVSGTAEFNFGFKRMTNPIIHVLENDQNVSDFAKIIPLYKDSEEISSAWIRRIMQNAFDFIGHFDSFVPKNLETKYKLLDYCEAIKLIHFPDSMQTLEAAKRTVKFSQTYMQQCAILKDFYNAESARQLINCEFFEDKLAKAIEAVSLYKEMGKQTIMLVSNAVKLKQYKQMFADKFKTFRVASASIDNTSSKESR